jgi:predicted nucleic acid-binding protein
MPIVFDASVTVAWYFSDEQTPKALEARDHLTQQGGLVPPHWWYEVRNALLMAERRGRMSEQLISLALASLVSLPIDAASFSDEATVFALARRHRLTFYDAAYLELALRERLALATFDQALAAAAKAENLPLVIATD